MRRIMAIGARLGSTSSDAEDGSHAEGTGCSVTFEASGAGDRERGWEPENILDNMARINARVGPLPVLQRTVAKHEARANRDLLFVLNTEARS
jgi:hypothetical protein